MAAVLGIDPGCSGSLVLITEHGVLSTLSWRTYPALLVRRDSESSHSPFTSMPSELSFVFTSPSKIGSTPIAAAQFLANSGSDVSSV